MHPEEYKEQNYLTYEGVKAQIKYLQGEMLTLIDASLSDKEQRNALKDIANRYFGKRLDVVFKITHEDLDHGDNDFSKQIK
ncbi:hypothetical protein ACGYLM_01415 [Sulfitobacter sp. 1A10445]|uniref:hypothetical protein n=1 Tax=unclassified Sulfitobacter TaxID=196795 RepID=UPI0037477106